MTARHQNDKNIQEIMLGLKSYSEKYNGISFFKDLFTLIPDEF